VVRQQFGLVTASAATTITASATAVAAATTAAATAIATTAATTTAAATTILAGLRFVDRESTAFVLVAIECCDCGLGLVIGAHFDKSKAFAPTCLAVLDDLSTLNCPMLGKQFL
jgi:hypothetical protein